MHILFIAHRPPFPPNKGEKIRTFNQLRHLKNAGHTISVCAPIANQNDIGDMQTLAVQFCEQVCYDQLPGKSSLVMALLLGRPLSVANFYSKGLQAKIDVLLQTTQIDAIICTSSSMAEYVFHSATLNDSSNTRPLLIMDFMDLDSDKWRQYQAAKPFPLSLIYAREARLLANYERKIHQYFDKSLFISPQEIELFLTNEQDAGKLVAVSNGLDIDFFQATSMRAEIDSPVFLFTGVMDYFPNSDAVIWFVETVWPHILKRWPAAQFYIAGMNPTTKVLALDKHQGIMVTGFVEDIREYYEKADFFIAPFRIARGVQNKVLQAFACGLPVISTPIGCEGIECKDQVHVLLADSADSFTHSVELLMSNQQTREHIRQNALDLVQANFSWAGRLQPLDQILQQGKP